MTASTIAILQLTTEIISGTRDFYKSVKNAPKEVSDLLDELQLFGAVLERLQYVSKQADDAAQQQTSAVPAAGVTQKTSRLPMLHTMVKADGPLTICYDTMSKLKDKLISDPSKLKKSLKWPFRKEEIVAEVQRLRNLRSVLDTAIASDNM